MTRSRLDAPFGQWIDRSESVDIRFEGKTYSGFMGDTVASALIANQQWLLSRSFKYHRPRGPLTLCGHDANTLVQLPEAPNRLADELPISEHRVINAQNYSGSLERDRNQLLDSLGRFMPVGFYYKAFYKPFGSWRFWERIIRRKAGLGVANLTVEPRYTDKQYLFHDIAIIGGGPAGLSAALTAAQAGASVLLIDDQPHLGGSLNYHRFDIDAAERAPTLNHLRTQILDNDNIRVLTSATCNGWFTDHYLPVLQGSRMYKVRAKACILASGSSEQHVVFRHNDLPGIALCSAIDRLIMLYGVAPAQRLAVLAGNDQAYLTALNAHDAGIAVCGVIDMRAACDDANLVTALQARHIPLFSHATVFEAHANSPGHQLAAIDIHRLDSHGAVTEHWTTLACGALAVSSGFMPAYQLACQGGARLSYDDGSALFSLTELPEGVFLAGSVNSIHALHAVLADGAHSARQALRHLGLAPVDSRDDGVSCDVSVNHPWPIFQHPKGREFVDFDEDLQIKDIVNSTRQGYRDIQLVKRFSTVGMGPSQGRHSALPTARLVAHATQRSVSETGVTTARPPVKPEPLGLLAGRRFDPARKTPLDQRHRALNAHMVPAGNWRRPAFYGAPQARDRWVQEEALAVRTNVGLIDVSTLGGIELRGVDAAQFLNRFYTFAFLKQPIGKTRYVVFTNEQGVVSDDGVAARIGADHFYVTATTTGVDTMVREMLRWNAQWRLNVDIANVTSAFAAINVAGPNARAVLDATDCSIDLSNDAFPYLAYREGHLGAIPVRMMRVGFVGELGYELHVPSMLAASLWDMLMNAGDPLTIRPFGVEAQRLLRLEKGHIIIGQDTDGMTHPGEVGLDWAINRQKPFFVGRRAVDIVMAADPCRQLVGFTVNSTCPQPKEGHLVIKAGDIVGHVTSCEHSPTVGGVIGLAYVHPQDAAPDSLFEVRTDQGVSVLARVCALPFYDPANARQAL